MSSIKLEFQLNVKIILTGILIFGVLSEIESFNDESDSNDEVAFQFRRPFQRLFEAIDKERKVENILLLQMQSSTNQQKFNCELEDMLNEHELPFMVQSLEFLNEFEIIKLNRVYSQESLIFVCTTENGHTLLKALETKTLRLMNNNRFLIDFKQQLSTTELASFCENCFEQDVYNVLLLTETFSRNWTYFSCQKYPTTDSPLKQKFLLNATKVFPNQFLDMHGGPIITQPFNLVPYTYRGFDKLDKPTMLGYMAKAVTTFAEKYNATLQFTIPATTIMHVSEAARFGFIDIAIIPFYEPSIPLNQTSNPYTIDRICILMPLQGNMPVKDIFFAVIRYKVFLMIFLLILVYDLLLKYNIKPLQRRPNRFNYWLNGKTLRLILGQPFSYPAKISLNACFVCLQVFCFGLWINAVYRAFLQSWLTQSPLKPPPTNADELEALNIKVLSIHWPYNEYLLGDLKRAKPQLLKYADSQEELMKFSFNFDTRFSYPIAMSHWLALNEQQQTFQRQLFYYSETMCVSQLEMLRFPLRPGLPYREIFNSFLLKVQESGLFRLWLKESFYDMVRLNVTSLKDFSSTMNFGAPLTVNDLSYIFCGFVCLLGASSLLFGLECIVFKVKSKKVAF